MNVMDRKEKDPLHAPDEPVGEDLPVEPEMQKRPDPPDKETGPRGPGS